MIITDDQFDELLGLVLSGRPNWSWTESTLRRLVYSLDSTKTFHQLMVVAHEAIADPRAKSPGVIRVHWADYLAKTAGRPPARPEQATKGNDTPRSTDPQTQTAYIAGLVTAPGAATAEQRDEALAGLPERFLPSRLRDEQWQLQHAAHDRMARRRRGWRSKIFGARKS